MYKRWITCCLALLMLLGTGLARAEEPALYANFLEGDFGEDHPQSMASFEGKLYVLGGRGLYLADPRDGSITTLSMTPDQVAEEAMPEENSFYGMERLFADDKGLLAYSGSSRTFYRVDLTSQPATKSLAFQIEGMEDVWFSSTAFEAPYFYGFEYGPKKVTRFNLETGEKKDITVGDVRGMAAYRDGQFVAMETRQEAGKWVQGYYAYNLETGEKTTLGVPENESVGWAVAYDRERDLIYSATSAQLFSYKAGDRESTPLAFLPRGDTYGLILLGLDHGAIFSDGLIAVRSLIPGATSGLTQLNIMEQFGRAGEYTNFLRNHAETEMVFMNPGIQTPEERFINDMLTKSDEVDIYLLTEQNLMAQIKKKGFAADLSMSAAIQEVVGHFEPPFREAAMLEDKILLVYKEAFVDLPVYAISAFEKLGYQAPRTFLEYYQLCERFITEDMDKNPEIVLRPFSNGLSLPQVLTQVAGEMIKNGQALDFEIPEVKALVQQINRVARLKIPENQDAREWIFYGYYIPALPEDRAHMLLTLKEGNQHAFPVSDSGFSYLLINPFSNKQEQALQFIESFVNNQPQSNSILLDKRFTQGVEQEGYQATMEQMENTLKVLEKGLASATGAEKSDLEENIKNHKEMMESYPWENRWQFSPEVMKKARELAPQAFIPEFNPVRLLVKEYPEFFEDYLSNENFNPDQFLSQLNQMVKTALIEQE